MQLSGTKKSQFHKRCFKSKGIHGFMLSSWGDLFRDGIIKRGHAFHSFINCVSLKVQLSRRTRYWGHRNQCCSLAFTELHFTEESETWIKRHGPRCRKEGWWPSWAGWWCVAGVQGKALWRRRSFRWILEDQEAFERHYRQKSKRKGMNVWRRKVC